MLYQVSLYRMAPRLVNWCASFHQAMAATHLNVSLPKTENVLYYPSPTILQMRPTLHAAVLFLSLCLGSYPLASLVEAASESSDNKTGGSQGVTIDGIGRGLKSAAKHIEEEIPKIGPGISKTFNHVTTSGKETSRPKESSPRVKPKK